MASNLIDKLDYLLNEIKGPCGREPLGQGVQDGKGPHGAGRRRKKVPDDDERFGSRGRPPRRKIPEWIEESVDQIASQVFTALSKLGFYGSEGIQARLIGGVENLELETQDRSDANRIYRDAKGILKKIGLDYLKGSRGREAFVCPDTELITELYPPRQQGDIWSIAISVVAPESRQYARVAKRYGIL